MKNIIKILFLAVATVSCSGTDDHTTESCLNPDLGITAEFSNPYPDHVPVYNLYEDWRWTMKNDSTLCISYEENQWSDHDTTIFRSYYYFSLDTKTNCATLIDAKAIEIGETIIVSDDGVASFPSWDLFESITSSELQEFDINDKIIGKNILIYENGYQETLQFWIEFTEENHFEFTELELNSGL